MKLEEIGYNYSNAGQFRAIMSTLGYSEQYNNGFLQFSRGDESFSLSLADIKEKAEPDISLQDASKEDVCKFFDREKASANFGEYRDELYKNQNITIVKWDNIKGINQDGFTIIDHNNKVSYTGKSLYDYAISNGFILDGSGSQLEKGSYSELLTIDGKKAKQFRGNKSGGIIRAKDEIHIPDKIFSKLSEDQIAALTRGEIVLIRDKKNKELFLQIDKQLNSVRILTSNEISIPNTFGGYELSDLDKLLLANGKHLPNTVFYDEKNKIYFNTELGLTEDKKGFDLRNLKELTPAEIKEYKETLKIATIMENSINAKQDPLTLSPTKNTKDHQKEGIEKDINRATDIIKELMSLEFNLSNADTNEDFNQHLDKANSIENELFQIISKYEKSKDIEEFGKAFINSEAETLMTLGIDKKLENIPYVKENPINTDKIQSPLHAVLAEFRILNIKSERNEIFEYEYECKQDPSLLDDRKYRGELMERAFDLGLEQEKLQSVLDQYTSLSQNLNISAPQLTKDDEQILDAIKADDFVKVNVMLNEGYKPTEALKTELNILDIPELKKAGIDKLLDMNEVKSMEKEQSIDKLAHEESITNSIADNNMLTADEKLYNDAIKTNDIQTQVEMIEKGVDKINPLEQTVSGSENVVSTPQLTKDDQQILDAVKADDFVKVNAMLNEGYKPTEALKAEFNTLDIPELKKAGISRLLGIDENKNKQAVIKTNKDKEEEKGQGKGNTKEKLLQATNGLFQGM